MIKFLYLLVFTVSRAAFGEGAGPVLVHGVSCTGTESSLLNCSHQIGVTYCSHFYDVGVVCPPCKSFLWHKFKGSHSWTNFTVVLVLTTVDIVKCVQILMHCYIMLTVETPDNIVFWSNFTLQAATYAHGKMTLKEDQQTKIYSDKQGSFQLRSGTCPIYENIQS